MREGARHAEGAVAELDELLAELRLGLAPHLRHAEAGARPQLAGAVRVAALVAVLAGALQVELAQGRLVELGVGGGGVGVLLVVATVEVRRGGGGRGRRRRVVLRVLGTHLGGVKVTLVTNLGLGSGLIIRRGGG